jgi:acylphosphatase
MTPMGDAAPRACLHCVVVGRVQGVGFRAFVLAQCRALGLTGWVRNRDDGRTVEVWAEGRPADVERLRDMLRLGPAAARVERVDCRPCAPSGAFTTFEVRR